MNEAKPPASKFDYDYDTDLLGFREVNGQLIPVHRMHPEPTRMPTMQQKKPVKKVEANSIKKSEANPVKKLEAKDAVKKAEPKELVKKLEPIVDAVKKVEPNGVVNKLEAIEVNKKLEPIEAIKKVEPYELVKKFDKKIESEKNKMIIDDNGKKFIIIQNKRVPLLDLRLKVEPKQELVKQEPGKPAVMRGVRAKIQNLLIDRKVLTRDLHRALKQVRVLKRELHKTKLGRLKYMRECKVLSRKSLKASKVKVKARRRTRVLKRVTQTTQTEEPEPMQIVESVIPELSLEISEEKVSPIYEQKISPITEEKVSPIAEETCVQNLYVGNSGHLYPEEDTSILSFNESVVRENVNMGYGVPVPRLDPKAEQLEKLKWIMLACIKMCNVPDTNGDFPIHNAVLNGIDAVRRQCAALKLRKIAVDLVNSDGYTPLQLGILNRAPAPIMKELKNYGADFGVLDHQGNTLYHLAVMNSHLETMYKNDLLPVINNAVNNYNYQGLTPLMICAKQNNYNDASVLVRHLKADLNLQDKTSGRTALFHAVESKSENMVALLLKLNADRSVKNFVGLMIQEAITELDVSPKIIAMLQQKVSEVTSSEFKPKGRRMYQVSQKFKIVSKKVKVTND